MPSIVRHLPDDPAIPSAASGPATKRQRLSADAEESSDVDNSWLLDPPGTARAANRTARHASGPRSVPGVMPSFKSGQLVRIAMKNFLTYTSATYHPGPTLNMIIGPNGTGKSSVVCAICIGLDFAPALLGRSKDLHEFVRHGCDEASVELEIKGEEGRVNPVVRLDFTKEGGKKTFYLNGRPCRAKDIHEVRRTFGIQVDNLCHFLPQDRVVEFSRLTPRDRLRETLRGAAPYHMTEQFEQLKEWAVEHRDITKLHEDKRATLINLEERQNNQRGDVERMRQRNELLQEIKFLQLQRPLAQAVKADFEIKDAASRKQVLEADLESLEQQQEPALSAIRDKEDYAKRVKRVRDTRKQLCDNFQRQVENCSKKEREQEGRYKESSARKEAIAKEERGIKSDIGRAQQKIQQLEHELKQEPVDFEPAEYNARIREKQRQIIGLNDKIDDTMTSGSNGQEDIQEKKHQIDDARRRIQGFQTQSGRQMEVLAGQSQETATAWRWIQENRHRFKGEVFGPPVLECSLKEERYAPMMESLFNRNDMLRIVVTQFEDLELLTEELQRKQGLSDVNFINQQSGLDRFRPPVSDEETKRLKVQGWALDLLKGPERVLATMCDVAKIHSTAVSWDDVSDHQFKQLEDSGLSSLLTSRSFYRITRRREYGPEATSTMVRTIPDTARWWTSRPVDPALEDNLRRDIATWEQEIEQMESERGNIKERVNRLRSEKDDLEGEIHDLETEKDDKVRHNNMLQGLPVKIKNEENKVEECQAKMVSLKEELESIKDERRDISLSRAQNSINLATAVENVRGAWSNYIAASIASIEAESDVVRLKESHADAQSQLQAKQDESKQVDDLSRDAKGRYKRVAKEWKKNLADNEGLGTWVETLNQAQRVRLPDELDTEVEATQARLEMLHEGDPRTIHEFETRARRIETLQQELGSAHETVDELKQKIERLRSDWEMELDRLVAKISEAFAASFEKINCLGSVEVGKSTDLHGEHDTPQQLSVNVNGDGAAAGQGRSYDFENWTIEIQVSFREGEKMSVLDSHRQSGGERAVTTIYYLMALQALSQAPFRVVDEINQGMDPRNERIVHERMVDIACNGGADTDVEDGGSQYFLITPKLLQGLKYDWRMKVHNVVSGEFMPKAEQGSEAVDFAKCVEKLRRMREGEAARRPGVVASGASTLLSVDM